MKILFRDEYNNLLFVQLKSDSVINLIDLYVVAIGANYSYTEKIYIK